MAFIKTSKGHRANLTLNINRVMVTFNSNLVAEVSDDDIEMLLNYDYTLSEYLEDGGKPAKKVDSDKTADAVSGAIAPVKNDDLAEPEAEPEVEPEAEPEIKLDISKAKSSELVDLFESDVEKYPTEEWGSLSGVADLRKYALSK